MSSDRPRPDHDKEGVVIPMRPSAPTSDDLREYLPSKGVARGALFEAKGDADPALVAKLHQMNAAESARPSKPSPWAKDGGAAAASIDAAALPSATGSKVEATTEAKVAAPAARTRRLRPWMVAAAVGAVALPVVITIVAMRAEMRAMLTAKPAGDVAAPVARTAIGATASTMPTAEATATAVSAAATTSAAAPVAPKHAPRPKTTANAAAPSLQPSAAPTVAPDILP